MPSHLAWHETLELHELVTFQSVGLMKLKKAVRKISDHELKELYLFSIQSLENNLRELLHFYPTAPRVKSEHHMATGDLFFYAGDLLMLAKTSVRNLAAAITETATPALRQILSKQLMAAVQWHGKVFYYMYKRGLYPAYHLDQLLAGDVKHATKALNMSH